MGGHGHSHGPDLEQPLLSSEHGHGGHGHESNAGHGHSHGHDGDGHKGCNGHGHDHGKQPSNLSDQERLKRAAYCALFFMLVEIVGGVISNSLAVITDAAHMLSDVGGFIVSLVALQLSAMAASQDYTYGFKQAEVLGALLSVALVWALTAILLWQAVPRFITPEEIDGKIMFIISVTGFAVNLVLMKVLGHSHGGEECHGHAHGEEEDSVAVQAAIAHVIGDIVQSLGVCLASLCIWLHPFDIGYTETPTGLVSNWNYADPLCTVLFGVIVLNTTKSTIMRTIHILMGKAPKKVNQAQLLENLMNIPNVASAHDLHVWSLGSSDIYLTAHLVVPKTDFASQALQAALKVARAAGVRHSTFQVEVEGDMSPLDCGGCEDEGGNQQDSGHGGHGGHGGNSHDGHSHGGHSHGGNSHGHSDNEGHQHAAGHSGHEGHGGHDSHGAEDCCSGHGHSH